MGEPIAQYVLKIHSRCDLACDHCYVYEHADQTWRDKPRVIPLVTVSMAARRIAENAAAHGTRQVSVILHGGEPLLTGKFRMREILRTLATIITPVTDLDLRVHSNGVRLDDEWCDLFARHGVRVGISVDGDRAANDRHRRFADGRSSYDKVLAALELLRRPRFRPVYAGILCTIDITSDPVAVYRALSAQAPPRLDFLLPHATWANPPYRPAGHEAPYADWLIRVHGCWDADGRRIPIRIFDSIISTAGGGPSFTEALGTNPVNLLVIDTNGAWEQSDSMKTAYDGAAGTGLSVFSHRADEAAGHPAIQARQGGREALCATCRSCPVVGVCGGGLYAHRYRPPPLALPSRDPSAASMADFAHPSVYCADLKSLIGQVTAAEHARTTPALVATERLPEPHQPTGPGEPGHWPRPALTDAAFDGLAAGAGDAGSLATLADKRLSDTRRLVAAVGRSATDAAWRDLGLRAASVAGWDLLCRLDRDHPRAVADVLASPHVFAWARRCLRPPPGADSDLDRAHLAALAAAATLRAGIAAELLVPVRRGLMHVPTAGAVAVDARHGTTRLLALEPGLQPAARGGRWRAARQVNAPPFTRVAVDDLDPFRDCQGWPVSGRLPGADWQAWRRRLASAGRQLTDAVPEYAQALGGGLRAIVPLQQPGTGDRSGTTQDAFGVVALALPGQGTARSGVSELLLREFQQVKLNLLLDRYALVNPGYHRRVPVPWPDEHLPASGALRGTYGYLAIAHLHQSRGRPGRAAFLRHRSWVTAVADALLAAGGALTPQGRRFVAGIAAAAEATAD
jgi:uncharacterized protein